MADRLRVRFAKVGKIRFTSHRDVARMWERALRRSGLPVARSQGFNPRPLVGFGLALPTGCESLAEYLDVSWPTPVDRPTAVPPWGDSYPDLGTLGLELSEFLPKGIDVGIPGMVGSD